MNLRAGGISRFLLAALAMMLGCLESPTMPERPEQQASVAFSGLNLILAAPPGVLTATAFDVVVNGEASGPTSVKIWVASGAGRAAVLPAGRAKVIPALYYTTMPSIESVIVLRAAVGCDTATALLRLMPRYDAWYR